MSVENESSFVFSPRPEAHSVTRWDGLLPPVRHAVRDLLLRIEGATRRRGKEEMVAANCFLVYGDRGTGKTTVLLNAMAACRSTETFFADADEKAQDYPVCRRARQSAEALKGVKWLEVLDLEPLPPRANLLTTVLTRVRNALYVDDSGQPGGETVSILEESTDSARHRFDQIIKDATLMWEDISEPDTRGRANRQVAAADIYARFQGRFKQAIEALSKELARTTGSPDGYRAIILPVDNIDRSTDHLYSIVKLAQMVSSPHLWLVMAGDRQDVDTFLERAYWKELIRVGEGAGATGKLGARGEDEALVMARRQAAAASHKLLPPSHRVEVGLVAPKHTLAFSLYPAVAPALPEPGYQKTIRQLLSEVQVTVHTADEDDRPAIRLTDLFDASDLVGKRGSDENHSAFTEAAEVGLRLPARGVLDLWQLAYWVTKDKSIESNRRAEIIARTMLRHAIRESSMSSDMGRFVHEKIIQRNPLGGTLLDFADPNQVVPSTLSVLRLSSWHLFYRLDSPIKASLEVRMARSLSLRLTRLQKLETSTQSGDESIELDDSSPIESLYDTNDETVPNLVSAWLTVLYDTLFWGAKDSAVITPASISATSNVIFRTETALATQWPNPEWESFIEHDIFGQLWRSFLAELKDHGKQTNTLFDRMLQEKLLPRLLVLGWIACALDTHAAFTARKEHARSMLNEISAKITEAEHLGAVIMQAERDVADRAAEIYERISGSSKGSGRVYWEEEEVTSLKAILDWLEGGLPMLLLTDAYVPMEADEKRQRRANIEAALSGKSLAAVGKTVVENLESSFATASQPETDETASAATIDEKAPDSDRDDRE